MTAPIPENEEQRLRWLRECAILDTLPEAAYTEAAALAAALCGVPTAVVNFIDRDRQWSKAAVGQDKTEDPREVSFCAHTIGYPDLMVVPDARADPRFADNPLVAGEPFIRFYAGAPIATTEGYAVGSLCIVDSVPHALTDAQAALLRLLARQLAAEVETRRHVALQTALISDRERLLRDLLAGVTDGRLALCFAEADLPPARTAFAGPVSLLAGGDGVRALRREAAAACRAAGIAGLRAFDFETAVGEAAMNAVVHTGGGTGWVSADAPGTVQVRIEDAGGGIPLGDLPNATLRRGYSTAGTMGHGFTMILMTADRVALLTGGAGTTVVLEQDTLAPAADWQPA